MRHHSEELFDSFASYYTIFKTLIFAPCCHHQNYAWKHLKQVLSTLYHHKMKSVADFFSILKKWNFLIKKKKLPGQWIMASFIRKLEKYHCFAAFSSPLPCCWQARNWTYLLPFEGKLISHRTFLESRGFFSIVKADLKETSWHPLFQTNINQQQSQTFSFISGTNPHIIQISSYGTFFLICILSRGDFFLAFL